MTTFIAIRKRDQSEVDLTTLHSVAERRATAIADKAGEGDAERLLSLGLTQVDPLAYSPHIRHRFHKLDFLKSYVIDTPNPAVAERARELLEPAYLIAPDMELTLPQPALQRTRPQLPSRAELWPVESGIAYAHQQGIIGKNVLVGILDTGCDADHIELREKRIDFRYVPLDPNVDVMRACRGFDVDGHGTHVAGVIGGKHVGVAPGVELMVASVIESKTLRTSLERVVIALNWMMAQFQLEANLGRPAIVNLSLGYQSDWVGETEIDAATRGIKQILTRLVQEYDVLPVVAIGNDGPGRMRAPAWYRETLSVGAVDQTLNPAAFSGGGRSPLFTEIEPDLVGLGVDIFSSLERTIDGTSVYARASGTSMAAPYVVGIAALAASAEPTLQGGRLRDYLVTNALPLNAPHDRVGAGLARFVA